MNLRDSPPMFVTSFLPMGSLFAQEAQTVRDTDSARVVLVVVLGLVGLGVALAVVTVWFWRATRPDHPVLVRLENLGTRRTRRRLAAQRTQQLATLSPPLDLDDSASAVDHPVP